MKVMRLYVGSLVAAEGDVVIAVGHVKVANDDHDHHLDHNDDEDDIVSFVGHLRQFGHVIVQVLLAGHLLVSQEYRRVPVGDGDDVDDEDDEDKHCR